MSTTTENAERQNRVKATTLAIARGELVRLLAEVDAGRLDPEEFDAAMEQYRNRRWFRVLMASLLGRRYL